VTLDLHGKTKEPPCPGPGGRLRRRYAWRQSRHRSRRLSLSARLAAYPGQGRVASPRDETRGCIEVDHNNTGLLLFGLMDLHCRHPRYGGTRVRRNPINV
jgi:hypothetical protein